MAPRSAIAIAAGLACLGRALASTAALDLNDPTTAWLDAYAQAAELPSLTKVFGPELRIWIVQAKSGRVVGYSVATAAVIECRTALSDSSQKITIERAQCTPARLPGHLGPALQLLGALQSLDGKVLGCGVADGEFVHVEGVTNGRRFTLRADNPNLCHDPGSSLIAKLLALLGAPDLAI